MKRINTITLIMALASLSVACVREVSILSAGSEPLVPVILSASQETTKTILSGGDVLWEDTDAISLFSGQDYGTKTALAVTSVGEDGHYATFEGLAAANTTSYIAVYPDSESNTCDGSTLTVSFPSQQTAVEGGFMSGANTSVAASESESLVFRNVGALIGVCLGESDAASESVTVRAKKAESGFCGLTGSVAVSMDDGIPVAAEGSADYVTLLAPEGGFKAGAIYYAVVCPGDYNGFELAFMKDGKTIGKYDPTSCTLKRSYVIKIGPVFSVPEGVPETLTVSLDFSQGWPFDEPCAAAADQVKEGESYTYTLEYSHDGQPQSMPLDFKISRGTVSTSIDYSYSDGALRFNSTGGNNGEIRLPGIDGYYLNRVDARHISAERSRFALKDYFIAKTETQNERLLAGWAATGALTMFWMPVTEGLATKQQPGQSFTLEMRDKNMAVSEIKLVYTKTKPVGEPPVDVTGRHLYAHRGKWSKDGSDYFVPENSLTGIQMAALMGYEGIECDVKYTKDKVMVVMHDATINKSMRNADYTEISGDVKVADLTFEELRNNYVLESTEPAFRLQCPTLEEMLLECKRCGMRPMLHSSIYESYELAQKIMGDNWVCFTGADFDNVLKVRSELKSNCTILWSISSGFDTVETELKQIGGDCGISSMESGYYTKDMIDRLRGAGYHVQCSIFPSGEERLAIDNGVDYILTDRVVPMGARTDITAAEILAAYPPQTTVTDELPDEFSVVLDFTAGWPFEGDGPVTDQMTWSGQPYDGQGDPYTYYHAYKSVIDGEEKKLPLEFIIARQRSSLGSEGLYTWTAQKGLYNTSDLGVILFPGIQNRYLKEVGVVGTSDSGSAFGLFAFGSSFPSSSYGAGANVETIYYLYEDKIVAANGTLGKGTVSLSQPVGVRLRQKNTITSLRLVYSSTSPGNAPSATAE